MRIVRMVSLVVGVAVVLGLIGLTAQRLSAQPPVYDQVWTVQCFAAPNAGQSEVVHVTQLTDPPADVQWVALGSSPGKVCSVIPGQDIGARPRP